MTYEEARKHLWGGHQMSRESWVTDFYIEVSHQDQNRRIELQDSCGRTYAISVVDTLANDWIIHREIHSESK